MTQTPPTGMSPEMIEKLRRGFPLELDAMGRLRFEGDEISHPRVLAFFRDAFDAKEDGTPIVAFEGQWTYLNPQDCVFRVTGVGRHPPEVPLLELDDGRKVELDPSTLRADPAGGLQAQVPSRGSGRALSARFSNRAAIQLAEWFDEEGRALLIDGQTHPIRGA